MDHSFLISSAAIKSGFFLRVKSVAEYTILTAANKPPAIKVVANVPYAKAARLKSRLVYSTL